MSRKRIEKNLAYDDGKRLFYVYFDYGRDAFGRRMRKTKTFSQKEMAKEALCRFEIRRLQNRLTPPTQMTLEHWLSYWLEDVIRPNREDTTYYCYHSIITNHIIPILGKVKIQQLTPYQIQAYYNQIMREKGLSSNTVYKHHILLHTALKMAHRQKLLPENPIDLVEAPHQQLPSQSYYNPKQLNKLFRAVEGDWLEIVVKLAGYLGLRRSEICGLRWEDVDLENGVIQIQCVRTTAGGKVVEKQPKSESSIRKLGIAGISDLVDLLREERFKASVPALAEAMESLRANMVIFCYQIRYAGFGKHKLSESLNVLKPDLERYTLLVQQIKNKTKERKTLLAEKKATPFYQFVAHNDLAKQIAELAEDLEELKSEKTMLLSSFDCSEDTGIAEVKKSVAAMEENLKRLTKQEEKYAAELEDALKQFSELREQAKNVDSMELAEQRIALQGEKIQSATSKIKAAYGEKFDPLILFNSKRDVSELLEEKTEVQSIREHLQKKQEQTSERKKTSKKHEQER